MQIEALPASDARQIIRLYKKELKQLGLLGSVYQSPKAATYIAFLCKSHLEHFYGLHLNQEVVAAIQLKQITASLHINNMVVDAKLQGKGYGSILMQQAIYLAQNKKLWLSLDVDSTNKKAFDWYSHLGFITSHKSYNSIFELKAATTIDPIILDNENFDKFGFSEISIPSLNQIKLFFILPNVYRMNSQVLLTLELLTQLNNSLNGLLLIDSELVADESLIYCDFQKISLRMLKNDI